MERQQNDSQVRTGAAALASRGKTRQGAAPSAHPRHVKKRTKVRAALRERARIELGDAATALDYVCAWVARGGLITDLAREIATDIGESCSPSFLSLITNRLGPDATARIVAARRDGVPPIQNTPSAASGLFGGALG